MNMADLIPVVLLALLSVGLSLSIGLVLLVLQFVRKNPPPAAQGPTPPAVCPYETTCYWRRPNCWLAVKSRQVVSVQSALGLHNPTPCSLAEGLAGERRLFIAPPVKGWILVMGSGLPDPSDDVDACFRLVLRLSRRLGPVQFFSANRALNHHAWVRADGGRVQRAYAWAGRTVWVQGECTPVERELGLECRAYGDPAEEIVFGDGIDLAPNVEKVPLLAARWSVDPAHMDDEFIGQEVGVAGEPSRWY